MVRENRKVALPSEEELRAGNDSVLVSNEDPVEPPPEPSQPSQQPADSGNKVRLRAKLSEI